LPWIPHYILWMNAPEPQVLNLGPLQIALGIECQVSSEHSIHFPETVLLFVDKGQLHFRRPTGDILVAADSFCLIRKHSFLAAYKTWTEAEGGFKMAAFVFEPDLVAEALKSAPFSREAHRNPGDLLVFEPHPAMVGFFRSLEPYFGSEAQLDRSQVLIKTQEALLSLARLQVDVFRFFQPQLPGTPVDLRQFLADHLTHRLTIAELARKSGRSLSTFNRDFKDQLGGSPHRWIKEQRLRLAHRILTQTDRKPSEIFLDLGFEDLPHFSRSFKDFFGVSPSTVSRPQALTQIGK
jgi:AraC family transcriptional regulator, exoenzyme S synthesis regulatory protein ExsA